MSFWGRLAWGCWAGHAEMVRERIKGRYVLVCSNCGYTRAFPKQRLRLKRSPPVKKGAKALPFARKQVS